MKDERELAADILTEMERRDAYGNLLLRDKLSRSVGLNTIQKAFVTELVNGCIRRRITLDHIINQCSKTPTLRMKPFILTMLRIGVYQLRYMDRVPASAAINEAVKLVKKRGFVNLCGFVNAVLRAVTRTETAYSDPNSDSVEFLSVKYSYPKWIVADWVKRYGFECAESICMADMSRPHIHLCVNTLRTSAEDLIAALSDEGVTGALIGCNGVSVSHTDDITQKIAFQKGLFHVMDYSSMQAVELLAPRPGDVLFDLCAAPGGKAIYAAYRMQNTGTIYASDIYDHKLKLINDAAQRLGISIIQTRRMDATLPIDRPASLADLVLADVPCSGLGVIRRKPDLKYRRTYNDVTALAAEQKKILANAAPLLRPGGVLLYSTCTITAEENEENIEWFTGHFPFALDRMVKILPSPELDQDGFFMARLMCLSHGNE